MAVAGCTGPTVIGGNYLTYDYAFNDAAAARARASAEQLCAQRKQMAIETSSVCTMTRCTTSYQCVSRENPGEYEPPDFLGNPY